jgi:hypothetical protein
MSHFLQSLWIVVLLFFLGSLVHQAHCHPTAPGGNDTYLADLEKFQESMHIMHNRVEYIGFQYPPQSRRVQGTRKIAVLDPLDLRLFPKNSKLPLIGSNGRRKSVDGLQTVISRWDYVVLCPDGWTMNEQVEKLVGPKLENNILSVCQNEQLDSLFKEVDEHGSIVMIATEKLDSVPEYRDYWP